jgi:hypothetical protein
MAILVVIFKSRWELRGIYSWIVYKKGVLNAHHWSRN